MRYVPYFYFLRIPLICALVLPMLTLVGLGIGDGPNSIVGGFFDLTGPEVFSFSWEHFSTAPRSRLRQRWRIHSEVWEIGSPNVPITRQLLHGTRRVLPPADDE